MTTPSPSDPTPTTDRWVESLADDAHGLVWTTKAELRQVLAQARTEALDVDVLHKAMERAFPLRVDPAILEDIAAEYRAILAGETE